MFIRDSWYVAAWAKEVGTETPLARTVLGEQLALFRTSNGAVAAIEGRCAHRGMSLANGKVQSDLIVCCYHGLAYDSLGKCVRIPGQGDRPNNVRVRSYPVAERYGAVWVWMGDPMLADETRIFQCEGIATDGADGFPFYFHVQANYLYINDNLSDLLHQAYLHNPSFGGGAAPLGETIPVVAEQESNITVRWDWPNVSAPGIFAEHGQIHGPADGWNHSTYTAPSFYVNAVGFADADTGGRMSQRPQGNGKISLVINQLITPETDRTTHFFKIVSCKWDKALLPALPLFIEPVNREDVWACEEQQKMADANSEARMTPIPTDKAVFTMRRLVERLYREEAARRSGADDAASNVIAGAVV